MQTNFPTSQIKHALVFECVGTAFLTIILNLANDNGIYHLPALVLTVLCCVLIFGNKSGSHVNPAITLAQLLGYVGTPIFWRKAQFAFAMMAGQFSGAFLGVGIVALLSKFDPNTHVMYPKPALLCPHPEIVPEGGDLCAVGTTGHFRIFFAEALFTFLFVTTVLSIIYHKSLDTTASAVVVSFSLFASINGAIQVSGACINPAVGLAQVVFQSQLVPTYYVTFNPDPTKQYKFTSGYEPLWAYVIGPLVGGAFAAFFKLYD
jgi:glycerol uptake facilitator-like aquaporin